MSILDSNCNIWINANAGSGKTTSLVKRFLSLVLNGTDFDKILCITYTKTAAKEMQHRITSVLQKWQLLNEQDLEQELENYTLENTRFYLQKASGLYDEIINSGKAFKISTIHSFCHNLLKQYGNVTEVTKETEILNNEIVDKLKKAIKQKLAKIDGEVLNEYRFILKHKGDFFIDNLMEEVFENIAFHTQNIGKNWEELIPDDALFLIKNEQSLSIFKDEITHSINNIGIDVLKAFLLELKIKIDIEENDDFFEAVCKGLLTKAGELRKLKLEKIKNERVVNIISDWQSFIVQKEQTKQAKLCKAGIILIQFVVYEYLKDQKEQNFISYGEMIYKTISFLSNPENKFVLYNIDNRIDHLMLDEAQDTNPESWQLIEILTEEFFAGYGTKDEKVRTIFVVGDVKQSIYSFQGANLALYDNYRLSFKKKSEGAKIRFVEQNLENSYRSTQKVLDFVDNFCNNFANKFALSFNIKEDIKHISKITQQIEDSEVSFVEIEQEVEGENEDVKNDFTSWVERTESLLQKSKIVEKVLIEITNFVNKRDGKTGIMFHNRTANNYMMFSLAEKLQEMNLLNSFITQLGRYDIKVMDIFTIFKFIQNPYNEFNLAVLLKTPIFNLTDDNIFAIQQKEKETFYERCLEFDQLKNNLLYLEQLKNCKLGFVVEKIEQMYQQVGSDEEVVVYLKYIKMLQSYIKETETEGVNIRTLDVEKLMNDFRDNIVNLAVGLNDDSDSKISFFGTIHESKGMEFDNTIIIDSPSNNGIKNTIYIIDNNKIWVNTNSNLCFNFVNIFKEMKKNLQEEELKRLYYVALTRAKKNALVVKLNDKGLSQYVE